MKNLSVSRDGTKVIHDVSMELLEGCWTGVVGANGSGKTTLLKVLAGRLPHDGGTMSFGLGGPVDRLGRAIRVSFAPEAAMLPASLTGAEILAMVAEDRPASTEPLETLREALEIGRLEGLRISAMSAGMRQRIAIYAAFVVRSDIVILDEPFNWLDPVCTFDVKEALRQLVDGHGFTLVTALHDFGTLTGYCDRGVLLADGCVVRLIAAEELRSGSSDLPRFESRLIRDLRGRTAADRL